MNNTKNSHETNLAGMDLPLQPGTRNVHIEFSDTMAESVAIAGTFNNWRPEPLIRIAEGCWGGDFALPPGSYEYCLVLDGGRWVTDPLAAETVQTPYGTYSVLKVD